jgi:succinate dehydrogenase / fumarate reductase, cytochrome b subunit
MARPRRRRPAFFNLIQIQMPVGALASIGHRVTGIFLALGLPFAIYLLDLSLRDAQSYDRVVSLFDRPVFRFAAIPFAWALAHHLLAGVRHLLSDADIGSQLRASRRSAWIVNLGGVAVALLAATALL